MFKEEESLTKGGDGKKKTTTKKKIMILQVHAAVLLFVDRTYHSDSYLCSTKDYSANTMVSKQAATTLIQTSRCSFSAVTL